MITIAVFFAVSDMCLLAQLCYHNFLSTSTFLACGYSSSPCLHRLSFLCSPATHCVFWIPHSLCLSHLNLLFSVQNWLTAPVPRIPPSTLYFIIFQGCFLVASPQDELSLDISSSGTQHCPTLSQICSFLCNVCWDKQVKASGSWAPWWWKQYKCFQIWVLTPSNILTAEFDGPSRLSELKPAERRAEITLCIVGFILISLESSNLNIVLQRARAIYFLPCPSLVDKKTKCCHLITGSLPYYKLYIKFCYDVFHFPKIKINICTHVNMIPAFGLSHRNFYFSILQLPVRFT